jgi:serine/threonine protein kinase
MKFRERYLFDSAKDFVGKGGFAKVFRAYDTIRKRYVALKFYSGSESEKYDIISEINRMDNLAHVNLIRYYDATIIDSVNAIGEKEQIQVGIMEFANAGDISTFFNKPQAPDITRQIILDILHGVAYLHENGIAHRDMKPKNILLSDENGRLTAKIADFGISKKVETGDDASISSQLLGSVEYMAPEQFAPAVYGIGGKLGTNADIWSLGIILYEIFTQKLPFGSRTKGITYEQILNNILFQELDIDYDLVPEPFRSVIRRCVIKSAAQRAHSAQELIAIIEGKNYKEPISNIHKIQDEGTKTSVFEPNAQNNNDQNSTDNNETRIITPIKQDDPPQARSEKPSDNEIYIRPTNVPQTDQASKNEIAAGKTLFKNGDYPESFAILDRYIPYLDTEAKFYLGFMYYNGKCGGAHDPEKGKKLMNEAKRENRPLVLELMLKYVLRK